MGLFLWIIGSLEHCDTKLSRMSHCHISCQWHKCVYMWDSGCIQCVCVWVFVREDGSDRRRQWATDSLLPVRGKVSQRTSARPLSLSACFFSVFLSLSLPTSLFHYLSLSFALCPSPVSSICCCASQYVWKLFRGIVASNKHTCLNACCLLHRQGWHCTIGKR